MPRLLEPRRVWPRDGAESRPGSRRARSGVVTVSSSTGASRANAEAVARRSSIRSNPPLRRDLSPCDMQCVLTSPSRPGARHDRAPQVPATRRRDPVRSRWSSRARHCFDADVARPQRKSIALGNDTSSERDELDRILQRSRFEWLRTDSVSSQSRTAGSVHRDKQCPHERSCSIE